MSDGPHIFRLLREFYRKQGGIYGIPMDSESAADSIAHVINTGVCLIGEKSCAGAIIVPFPFNHNAMVAQVIFWYFKRPREIEIFRALALACQTAGATHISSASHFPNNTVGRYYEERLKLNPVEISFMCPLVSADNKPSAGEAK